MKSGGHLISCAVMAMVLVWASTADGGIYLYVNGEDQSDIYLMPGEPCTFEIVSDDYIPYVAYVGWDLVHFFNGPVLGTFILSTIMPEAGDLAYSELYDLPPDWYLYGIFPDEFTLIPGTHFVYDYFSDETGETDLLLTDETYAFIIDSIHIYVGGGPGDTDPPIPNPMTWAPPPEAVGGRPRHVQ